MIDHTYKHFLFGLIAVANNIPAIPLYLDLTRGLHRAEQHRLCLIATATSFITMITAMLSGMAILNFFEISISAFRIAGGLLLLNTGLSMMTTSQGIVVRGTDTEFSKIISMAVIPVSIPLTTGAGTISTIILFSHQCHLCARPMFELLAAILTMTLLIYISFRYSTLIVRFLGETGMDVLSKIFGLITLALGIQFIIGGIEGAFPKLMLTPGLIQ
jgi:multiple antibiotic resistance protein